MTLLNLINSGKTKKLYALPGEPTLAQMHSEDDITAGDGAKHDSFERKAVYATTTTKNVFLLLEACGIPTAFVREEGPADLIVRKCQMLLYEVVARRLALGSYCKRNPHVPKGTRFEALVVEFYLKTSGKDFKGTPLEKDDPLIVSILPEGIQVTRPDIPDAPSVPIEGKLLGWKSGGEDGYMDPFGEMERLARLVFLVLEKAWALQAHTLADLKIEFGITTEGKLVVADVIDNDSWRVLTASGEHLDKQLYRENVELETVAKRYEEVAQRSERFAELAARKLRIIVWCASTKDNLKPFLDAYPTYGLTPGEFSVMAGSMHKAPLQLLPGLQRILADVSTDIGLIVYVGRSNGAGPVIAGATHLPVITVPADSRQFPDDVWSSLRMPSDLPLMTVLDPGNAILAALNILGTHNPRAYMAARRARESHWLNWENSPTFGRNI
ncbi:MAG: phosphoribosylaminoimidazolesuccinocarboxamide synthase [Minisyncoccia bacterium]